MKKYPWALALTAATLPLLATPAHAVEPSDPRAMSLGGHYAAFANSDVNGTQINPALLSNQRGLFYLGPNLGLSAGVNAALGNDIASAQSNFSDVLSYFSYLQSYMAYSTSLSSNGAATAPTALVLPTILDQVRTDGLKLSLGTQSGIFGLRLPFPSLLGVRNPADAKGKSTGAMGSIGVRMWVDGGLDVALSAPEVFTVVSNFPTLDQTLKTKIHGMFDSLANSNNLSTTMLSPQVDAIRSTIADPSGFGLFMLKDANDNGDRKVTLSETNRAYATTAVTLTQPIPLPGLPFFAHPKGSVGGAFKLFTGLGQVPDNYNPLITAGNTAATAPVVGAPGSLSVSANLNLSSQLTTLDTALKSFRDDPTKIGNLQSEFGKFSSLDYSTLMSFDVKSRAASQFGAGCDVGASVDLDDRLSLGVSLANPVVAWPGKESNMHGTPGTGGAINWAAVGGATDINFTDTEPTKLALGAAYRLPLGFTVMGDFDQTFDGSPLAMQGGVEWSFFNLFYLRGGARFGGSSPQYGGGAGLNLWITKLDLALAADPQLKSVSGAVSWGLGF